MKKKTLQNPAKTVASKPGPVPPYQALNITAAKKSGEISSKSQSVGRVSPLVSNVAAATDAIASPYNHTSRRQPREAIPILRKIDGFALSMPHQHNAPAPLVG